MVKKIMQGEYFFTHMGNLQTVTADGFSTGENTEVFLCSECRGLTTQIEIKNHVKYHKRINDYMAQVDKLQGHIGNLRRKTIF